jgi:transcriptional regulator with XRE-family HTH domain
MQDQEAAVVLEIDRSFLSQLLAGKRLPSLPNAVHIEQVTGVPVAAWVPTAIGKAAADGWTARKKRFGGKAQLGYVKS